MNNLNSSKFNFINHVYLFKSDSGPYKIGVSTRPNKRLKEHQTGNPDNITMVHCYPTELAYRVEYAIKNYLESYKINREWFDLPLEIEIGFIELCKKYEENIRLIMKNNEDLGNFSD
jgi:predicted GIY-YIG superfamily endonuclease